MIFGARTLLSQATSKPNQAAFNRQISPLLFISISCEKNTTLQKTKKT
jgi:hypothetical protein